MSKSIIIFSVPLNKVEANDTQTKINATRTTFTGFGLLQCLHFKAFWKTLPQNITHCDSINTFKRLLKTGL